MQIKYKYHILAILLCLWTTIGWAQTPKPSFTLEDDESPETKNYEARNFIDLKNGFKFTATTAGKSFIAKIAPTLMFSIISVPNPTPGDVSGAASDKSYTPGGTYSTDPVQTVPDIMTYSKKVDGSGNIVAIDTSYLYPVLWFKTVPVTNNLNGAYVWRDITGNNTKLLRYSLQGAGVGTEYQVTRDTMRTYNFNPAINVACENINKEILINKSNLTQTTVIGVWGVKKEFDKDNFIFAINGRRNEGMLFTKEYVEEGDSTIDKLSYGSTTGKNLMCLSNSDSISRFQEKSLRVATYYRSNKPNTSVWGEAQKAVISLGGKFNTADVNNTSHYIIAANDTAAFKGFSPELLVFDRQLSPVDCNKFETYLAIKYGLTLDNSYVAPDGTVVWDYNSNTSYNHRITGYGREDGMGLYQKMSTTSYEEAPYYSNQTSNDSYDMNDSYHLSSRNRLLVMGCEPANTLENGKYVIFGDNKDSLKIATGLISGFAAMSRKWLVCTNISQSTETNKVLNWLNAGLTIDATGFKSNILKSGSQTVSSAVTTQTLKGTDGYFAWTVEQEYGPITVKFGTGLAQLTPNSYDYGYKIDSVGQVYPVQRGVVSTYSLFSVQKGQRLEVEKNGRVMDLRVNGVRYKNTEFIIDSTDINKTYYGAVIIGKNPYDILLSNFRHGGFVDTGNKIELSYISQRASDFANYKNGQTYLLIDRSGTGNFSGVIDSYPCDESDSTRSKIIFHNVFWNTDGNGRDAFTFGYKITTPPNKVKETSDPVVPEPAIEKPCLSIYYKDLRDLSNVTVKLKLVKPSISTVFMFDLMGRLIYTYNLPASNEVQCLDIKLPNSGVYIIKAVTNEGEATAKVISKTGY